MEKPQLHAYYDYDEVFDYLKHFYEEKGWEWPESDTFVRNVFNMEHMKTTYDHNFTINFYAISKSKTHTAPLIQVSKVLVDELGLKDGPVTLRHSQTREEV